MTGCLPPVESLIDIFMSDDNIAVLKDIGTFIFLLCASVIEYFDLYKSLRNPTYERKAMLG